MTVAQVSVPMLAWERQALQLLEQESAKLQALVVQEAGQ
jgi:hypothetical protein